jgi:hypothetical protein
VEKILNTPNLECDESERIIQAFDTFVHENVDYIDAYHAFLMKDLGITRIATYDRKHFGRIPWVEMIEPKLRASECGASACTLHEFRSRYAQPFPWWRRALARLWSYFLNSNPWA